MNDSGVIDVADAVYLLTYLFASGLPPASPFPDCGEDTTGDALDCLGPLSACSPPFSGSIFLAREYAVGGQPSGVALGDFNSDGHIDAVSSNSSDSSFSPHTVSVLLGAGDGTFADQVQSSLGADNPVSISIGDFDGDGELDVITPNSSTSPGMTGSLSVLRGYGDGTFAAALQFSSSGYPRVVALGDLDNDGAIDAVTNSWTSINVFLGLGDGSFVFAGSHSLNGGVGSVVLADLNDDGDVDSVVSVGSATSSTVEVLIGNGDGTFASQVPYALDLTESVFGVAELTGDSSLDVIAANYDEIKVFPGNGDGTLSAVIESLGSGGTSSVSSYLTRLALGDLDGNGHFDLVTTRFDGVSPWVYSFAGNGDGTFDTPISQNPGAWPASPSLGDVDENGDLDVVVVNTGYSSKSILPLLGNGDGSLAANRVYPFSTPDYYMSSFSLGDIDNDGIVDALFTSKGEPGEQPPIPGEITLLAGVADGTFESESSQILASFPAAATLADFNSDGFVDAVTLNAIFPPSGRISSLLGDGTGLFQELSSLGSLPPAYPLAIHAGDINNDGMLDVVTTSSDEATSFLGNGDGTFILESTVWVGAEPVNFSLGDIDNDGNLDIATANYAASTLSFALGNGDGSFEQPSIQYVVAFDPRSVLLADLNGDGNLDAISGNASGSCSVLLGLGDGLFATPIGYDVVVTYGFYPNIALGDVNGDSSLDLLLVQPFSVSLMLGDGVGAFGAVQRFGVGVYSEWIEVADLDLDGNLDAITGGRFGSSVLLNQRLSP
ncbi:MAG: FG-GAP repeat domain-containing protein [Planctomycetota bacterium]